MAVYAFFLIRFNDPEVKAPVEDLYGERHLLAELEREIDRSRQGEHEAYSWQQLKDVLDFRLKIGPCISKVNKIIEATLGKNRLSSHYRVSTGKYYGVRVPGFEVIGPAGRPSRHGRQ
jgi:hypothetical protein